MHAPRSLFLGRQLSEGAASHLAALDLSARPYLGRTTLPPDLAYLMAVQAGVRGGSVVLDPFCGTASILMSCAVLGATTTAGVDIDAAVLNGRIEGGRAGIAANFEAAGLYPPSTLIVGDMADIDQLLPPVQGSAFKAFDAIVTDPPYGLMEGLGSFYQPLSRRLTQLLCLACRRLRTGGRLVFLLPLPPTTPSEQAMPSRSLPSSELLTVETITRQRLSPRMHRLMVTLVKSPPAPSNGAGAARAAAAGATIDEEDKGWMEWWSTLDDIERAIAPEARRVW